MDAPAPSPLPPRHSRLKSLGARLVIFFVILLVIVQGLGALLVIRANSQIARQTIDQELGQGERVFRQLLAQRQARLEQAAAILSADFAFRQAIATNNTGTIVSVLRNHGARVGATVMTLVDLDRSVRADTRDENLTGKPFVFPALVDVSASQGKASSIVLIDGRVQQLVVVPVLAPDPIAYVALGFEVDDAVARELHQITGLEVTFLSRMRGTGWRIHSSTVPVSLRDALVGAFTTPSEEAGGFRQLELA